MSAMHGPVYRHRLRVLIDSIIPHLRPGDEVLDVGCGNGTLGSALMADPRCPRGVVVKGLERVPRGGEPIEVIGYDGGAIPLADGSFDVVIVADVLHHEPEPDRLGAECARIARRLLVVKDHQIKGLLAQQRVSLIDWAANAPYGVPCLYRYPTAAGWRAFRERLGMEPVEERSGMRLYPFGFEQFFGGSLQYMAVLAHPARAEVDASGADDLEVGTLGAGTLGAGS
jgi:SAM-dependent methyltransferase